MSEQVKIVVFVPESHADVVREAMAEAGAGKIGNYTGCSFSSKGVGRFLPQEGAHPTIGEVGKVEAVEEERIEMVCSREKLNEVISAIKRVHPYEEVAMDVYPIIDDNEYEGVEMNENESIQGIVNQLNSISTEAYRQRLTILGFIWAAITVVMGVIAKQEGVLPLVSIEINLITTALVSASLGIILQMVAYQISWHHLNKLRLYGEAKVVSQQIEEWKTRSDKAHAIGSQKAEALSEDMLWLLHRGDKMCRGSRVSFKAFVYLGAWADGLGFAAILLSIAAVVMFVLVKI